MRSLVTVIISTYNSSRFVAETLDSVFNQTWPDIELIITDDCSSDNTLAVCRTWISENGKRFKNAIILTAAFNTGVSANANRGLKIASGEWIKFIAADDTLLPDCISENVHFIDDKPGINALFSKINIYLDSFEKENLIETTPVGEVDQDSIIWSPRTAESQYRMLLLSDRIHFSPSVFLRRETLLSIGGFDERFKLLEDYPLWLNLTKNGNKLYFMDKVTVNYRRHSKAINNNDLNFLINPNYFRNERFRKIYTYPFLPADIRLNQRYIWYVSQIFRFNWLKRNTKVNKFILSIITIYLNPFKYFIWLRSYFFKNLECNEFYA